MGRHRKKNKRPMSSVSVQEDLLLDLRQNKPWNRTYGDFINTIFNEWKEWKGVIKEWKDTVPFMEETIKSQENKIKELNEVIEVLEKDNKELEDNNKNSSEVRRVW